MKQHYFVTGSSTGIGKALVDALLLQPNTTVTGIARSCTVEHPNYTHVTADLSNASTVKSIDFEVPQGVQKIVLVNNAGTLGEVAPLCITTDDSIEQALYLNMIAPAVLMNRFVAQLKEHSAAKIVLNVSSGAGKRPIDGWASYCASKAALDLFSEVAQEEIKLGQNSGFQFLSVAPGVVDTPMQAKIRSTEPANFTGHQRFVDFHKEGELTSAEQVAEKYLKLLNEPERFPDVIYSLRDL